MPKPISELSDTELTAIAVGLPPVAELSDEQLAGIATEQGYLKDEEATQAVIEKRKQERAPEAVGTAAAIASNPVGGLPLPVAHALLTKGGKVGDVAASVLAPIAGTIAGAAVGNVPGAVVGGGSGGAAGDAFVQLRRYFRGEQDGLRKGELTAATVAGAVPLGGPLLKTGTRVVATRVAQGAAISMGAQAVGQLIDEGKLNLGELAETGALGALFGGVAGAGEAVLVRRSVLRAVRRTPEFQGFKGTDGELVAAVRAKMRPAAPAGTAPKEPVNVTPGKEAAPVPGETAIVRTGAEAEFSARAGMADEVRLTPGTVIRPAAGDVAAAEAAAVLGQRGATIAPTVGPADLRGLSDDALQQLARTTPAPTPATGAAAEIPPAVIPREIPAPVEKVVDVVVKPKGRKPGFAPRADGVHDLIDIVQELGGVPKPRLDRARGGEFDAFENTFIGPLKTLVDERSRGGMDLFLKSVTEADSTHVYANAEELGVALQQAVAGRQQLDRAMKTQAYQQKLETALYDNKGRSKDLKAAAGVLSDDVVVGSTLRVHGELLTAADVDADTGALILRGSTTVKVPAGTMLFPDRGEIVAPPAEASPEELTPFENPATFGGAPFDEAQDAPAGADLVQKRMHAALEAGNTRKYLALRRQWLHLQASPPAKPESPSPGSELPAGGEGSPTEGQQLRLLETAQLELPYEIPRKTGGTQIAFPAQAAGEATRRLPGDRGGAGIGVDPATYLADPFQYAGELREALAEKGRISSIVADYFAGKLPGWSPVGKIVRTAADVGAMMQPLRNPYAESYKVVVLNARDRVVHAEVVHIGTIGEVNASINAVLRVAGKTKATRLVLSHNHPSGDPTPSRADRSIHYLMRERLNAHGIDLVDDVVTNGHTAYSLRHDQLVDVDHATPSPWEKVARGDLKKLNSPELVAQLSAQLRQSNSESAFVFYLTQRHNLTAIEQVPATANVDQLARLIEAGAAREGGAAVIVAMRSMDSFSVGRLERTLKHSTALLEVYTDLEGSHFKNGSFSGRQAPAERAAAGETKTLQEPAAEYGGELDPDAPFVAHSAKGKEHDFAKVRLAHLPNIKIVQMPELVRLMRELVGQIPQLKKMGGGKLGVFEHRGPEMRIRLDPRIFRDPIVAAKVLAHELGHLKDYLPTHTLKRGNLLGHLFALDKFMQGTFGAAAVDNAMVRAELKALTRWWRPFDADAAKDWYRKYRYSAAELYADAISVLFNSPAELKAHAPHFWTELFRALDRRPEVKTRLLEMWDFLNKPHLQVLQRRSDDIRQMFVAGDEIWLRKAAEREARYATFRGWSDRFRAELFDTFDPLVRKATKLERKGTTVPASYNPRLVFDEHPLADNRNYEMMQHLWAGVVQPVEAEGYTLHELGEYLFLQRVLNESFDPELGTTGRTELANPLGMTPETARLGLLRMRLQGGVRFTRLEAAAAKFHDIIFERVREAVDVGAYSAKIFAEVLEPNRSTYATFAVLDHLQDYVPASLRLQQGTLKEIANPFTATVLKTVTLNRLIQLQRSKRSAVQFLQQFDPTSITPAPRTFDGRSFHVQDPQTPDKATLPILEDGKPAGYHVDPAVAEMFEKLPSATVSAITTVLNWPFRKLVYPLIIKYNPAFQLVLSPLKDLRRTFNNLPRGRGLVYAGEYVRNYLTFLGLPPTEAGAAVRAYLRGEPHPLIAEMIAKQAIGTPLDNFAVDLGRGDKMEQMLRDFGLLPEEQKKSALRTLLTPLRAIVERIEFAGLTFEMLPKVTSYKLLTRDLGWDPREAAYFARNSVGVPNIYKKGRHVQVVDAIAPFFKVFVNGTRNDVGLALNPKTAGGWWFRWALHDGIWTILQAAAAAGLLGAALKELYDGVSDYNKSNYNVIPLGTIEGGQFGKRVAYVRIPRDETHRWMSGILYQGFMAAAGEASKLGAQSVIGFGSEQLPGLNPVLKIGKGWADFLEGENPMDGFRGRPVLTNSEWLAGGWPAYKGMIGFTLQNTGATNFVRWDSQASSTAEMTLSAVPGLNRFVQTTDTGYRERQEEQQLGESRQRAQVRVQMPENVQNLLGEYYYLASVKTELRTLEQTQRLMMLKRWRTTVYQPVEDAAGAVIAFGGKPERELLLSLERASEIYQRGR